MTDLFVLTSIPPCVGMEPVVSVFLILVQEPFCETLEGELGINSENLGRCGASVVFTA